VHLNLARFKLIVSDPETGRSTAMELEGARAQALIGRGIGDLVDGSMIGISASKLLITGGCDKEGIPMRPDVHGAAKKYLVLAGGVGFKAKDSGERRRKLVRGRMITEETYQINAKIIKEPKKKIIEESISAVTSLPGPIERVEERSSEAKEKPRKRAR
jgi:small subunit ribosomal protein S6e